MEEHPHRVLFVTVSDDRSGRKGGTYGNTQDKVLEFFKVHNPGFGITDYLFMKYYDDIVDSEFYRANKTMLDNVYPDMNGRCYKPYAILEGLKRLDYGDFLIYNDVSPELWAFIDTQKIIPTSQYSIHTMKRLCVENGGILTPLTGGNDIRENYHRHEFYTLERCMARMNLREYTHSLQHAGGIIVLQKTEKTVKFVEEWLHYNCIDECASLGTITSVPIVRNFWDEEYVHKSGHRHDQSISGLLINKLGNKLVISPPNMYPAYNFLSFCVTGFSYSFVDSKQAPTKHMLRTVFNPQAKTWETKVFQRS